MTLLLFLCVHSAIHHLGFMGLLYIYSSIFTSENCAKLLRSLIFSLNLYIRVIGGRFWMIPYPLFPKYTDRRGALIPHCYRLRLCSFVSNVD